MASSSRSSSLRTLLTSPLSTRDEVVDFVRAWADKTELPAGRLIRWIGVARGKFFDWRNRYGKANEHNPLVPRDHWIEP